MQKADIRQRGKMKAALRQHCRAAFVTPAQRLKGEPIVTFKTAFGAGAATLTKLAVTALLGLAAQPAWAQSSDSATVEALANLVIADEPLSLTVVSALTFGQVVIPSQGNATCTYEIRRDGNRGVRQDNVDYGLAPTPAGCTFRDSSADRATLTLLCEADRVVALTVLSDSSGIQGNAVFFETFDDFLEVDGQERYEWNQNCTGREMTLRLGGQLAIQGEARPTGEGVQVGSVTIEAFYP